MTSNLSNLDDMDRIDKLALALEQARTLFLAQIREAGCGGNAYLESLASIGMDICETALRAAITTEK